MKTQLFTPTAQLFQHLHRGGEYAHLWTDEGNESYWFRVNKTGVRRVPRRWLHKNIYFTIHPLTQIPPQNASGNRRRRYISSQLPYIAAVNTLFAEYDAKDLVLSAEYAPYLPANLATLRPVEQRTAIKTAKETAFYRAPALYKPRAWAQIAELTYPPSVVVDSGGGYHCYWLLRDSVPVDETNRADLQALQYAWVQMVGGDPGASDLRRLLRVPGSYNMKPGFGPTHPRVEFVRIDFEQLYNFCELDEVVNEWLYRQRPPKTSREPRRGTFFERGSDLRATFNQRNRLVDLLTSYGYQVCFQTGAITRLARPGRERTHSSVTVFLAQKTGAPELAVHFSTNDELYCEEYIDTQTGQVRRHAHDAFYTYVMLTHQGDWRAAYADLDLNYHTMYDSCVYNPYSEDKRVNCVFLRTLGSAVLHARKKLTIRP